jgi:hypothetical protein
MTVISYVAHKEVDVPFPLPFIDGTGAISFFKCEIHPPILRRTSGEARGRDTVTPDRLNWFLD